MTNGLKNKILLGIVAIELLAITAGKIAVKRQIKERLMMQYNTTDASQILRIKQAVRKVRPNVDVVL